MGKKTGGGEDPERADINSVVRKAEIMEHRKRAKERERELKAAARKHLASIGVDVDELEEKERLDYEAAMAAAKKRVAILKKAVRAATPKESKKSIEAQVRAYYGLSEKGGD